MSTKDATLKLIEDLKDQSKWKIVPDVPIFTVHDRYDVNGIRVSVLPDETPPEGGKHLYRVDRPRLEKIAARINRNLKANSTPMKLIKGHSKDPGSELVGYGVGARVGDWNGKAAIYTNKYIKPDRFERVKDCMQRSSEYYPRSDDITAVAMLDREDPSLPLGMVAMYEKELGDCEFYNSANTPEMYVIGDESDKEKGKKSGESAMSGESHDEKLGYARAFHDRLTDHLLKIGRAHGPQSKHFLDSDLSRLHESLKEGMEDQVVHSYEDPQRVARRVKETLDSLAANYKDHPALAKHVPKIKKTLADFAGTENYDMGMGGDPSQGMGGQPAPDPGAPDPTAAPNGNDLSPEEAMQVERIWNWMQNNIPEIRYLVQVYEAANTPPEQPVTPGAPGDNMPQAAAPGGTGPQGSGTPPTAAPAAYQREVADLQAKLKTATENYKREAAERSLASLVREVVVKDPAKLRNRLVLAATDDDRRAIEQDVRENYAKRVNGGNDPTSDSPLPVEEGPENYAAIEPTTAEIEPIMSKNGWSFSSLEQFKQAREIARGQKRKALIN